MNTYTLDVSDDYITEIQAKDDQDAIDHAERVARQHGSLIEVLVFRGPMISGQRPFHSVTTDGRGEVR